MDIHERLTAARKQAGFETAKEAADALGESYPTYAGHENGSSGFRAPKGRKYARRFKVRFEWLMNGDGPMTDLSSKHREVLENFDRLSPELQEQYAGILRSLARPDQSSGHDPEHIQEDIE